MKKRPSKLRKFLSLNQHRKRWGGRRQGSESTDIAHLKSTTIELGPARQTRGSSKSLEQHLDALRVEFSGQSELLWYHSKLIVLIRREFQTDHHYDEFSAIWRVERDFLLKNLNMRWLIAATDTFAEQDDDPQIRSVAMTASLLVNTIKMYETERYLSKCKNIPIDQERLAKVQTQLVPLFEGLSCFTVGTDDTLRNCVWRLQPFFKLEPVGPILEEIWRRLQLEDSVFNRMRALHTRDRTSWWNEPIKSELH